MKSLKILSPVKQKKTKLVNFRISEENRAAFQAKLEKEGLGPQAFFDQILVAYLSGKIS